MIARCGRERKEKGLEEGRTYVELKWFIRTKMIHYRFPALGQNGWAFPPVGWIIMCGLPKKPKRDLGRRWLSTAERIPKGPDCPHQVTGQQFLP